MMSLMMAMSFKISMDMNVSALDLNLKVCFYKLNSMRQ